MTELATKAAELLGEALTEARPLRGGDLSEVVRLRLASGRTAIAKSGDLAISEAEMLKAIASVGVPAPEVLASEHGVLVLQDIGSDTGLGRAWSDLGRVLGRLHAYHGEDYGWPAHHRFGPVEILNTPAETWPEFWAERRLLAGLAEVPRDIADAVERLCVRLGTLLPAEPPASLLHGDLWTGNVMASGRRVTGLIDPACYYGHAEVDLAMLTLFGSPTDAFWAAYGETEEGMTTRRPVYQLWPALVHLRLFGASYRGLVERLLSEIG